MEDVMRAGTEAGVSDDRLAKLRAYLTEQEYSDAVDVARRFTKAQIEAAAAGTEIPSEQMADIQSKLFVKDGPDYDKPAEDIYHGRYAHIDGQLDDYARKEIEGRIMKKILKERKHEKDTKRNQRKVKRQNKKKANKR